MPVTAAIAALAALSLAALPPAFGFIGKEMLLEASLDAPAGAGLLTLALLLASIVFVAAAGIIAIRPFFGKKSATAKRPHEAPSSLWFPPMLLACLGILFGVMPSLVEDPFLRSAVQAIVREPVTLHLALWHGFNSPLTLSAVSLACGVALYAGRRQARSLPRVCK